MRTSSGDFEGAFDVFLSLDLAEISLYQRADLFHCQGRLWVDDHLTNKMLEKVAKESSVGTPRAINEDILDQGYTVEGKALVNHLSVRQSHAERMQANPAQVRSQLGDSVCRNNGFRNLMSKGAVMVYRFTVYKTNQPIMDQAFDKASCVAGNKKTYTPRPG